MYFFIIKVKENYMYQKRIQNPVRHPKWSFLEKVVNDFKMLTIFTKYSIITF